ncbi:WD40 repeat-like protein [Hesseltinella vesiculosa]|uniref:WD40 repeat-like protein n=1 Tax=Hesseltinella vesiculosa TaxID=101127 RepID=A0A1X2G954_9FUNG|nr:WD40 repeat-like protein [Hesseltinella vesiculosa]
MEVTFSHLYKHSGFHVSISPNGKYVANVADTRLVIRDHSQQLVVMHVYETNQAIDWCQWSPNSQYVATLNKNKGVANVWSINDTSWKVTLSDRRFGMEHAWWAPDSCAMLIPSRYELQLTVWLFKRKETRTLDNPKYATQGCCASPDGKYITVLQIKDAKDHLLILDATSFRLLVEFDLDTADATHVSWSPDSQFIVTFDNSIQYKVLVYDLRGQLVWTYSAYEEGLGMKSLAWYGHWLALGSYDGKVRMIHSGSWSLSATFHHPASIKDVTSSAVYEEYVLPNQIKRSLETYVDYRQVSRRPLQLPILRPEYHQPNPKIGIGHCSFSCQGNFLATVNDAMPNVVWIWDLEQGTKSAISHLHPVNQIAWNPAQTVLAIVSGEDHLYFIYPGASDDWIAHPIRLAPGQVSIRQVHWSPDGKHLLALDPKLYCFASVFGMKHK